MHKIEHRTGRSPARPRDVAELSLVLVWYTASCSRSRVIWTARALRPEHALVQFLCKAMDFAGQLGVGLQFQFRLLEVVIGFGLLEGGPPILADHHEGRQENRLKRHHEGQGWPRALLQNKHPDGKQRGVNEDEAHRA